MFKNNIEIFRKPKAKILKNNILNKYISEIKTQPKNNNLDYMIETTFRNINRLFLNSFKIGQNEPMTDSFDKHFLSSVEIKDLKVLIDKELFFD